MLTLAASEKMDQGGQARVELAAVKAWGARALNRVMDRAVQVFGARGLTELTSLSSMYRMARAARFYDGPDEVHISTVGREIVISTPAADDTTSRSRTSCPPPPPPPPKL